MLKTWFKNSITLLAFSALIFVVLLVLLFTGIIDEYNGNLLAVAGIYVIIALSLNLITGFTGQLALGQAGFMAVGAYTTAIFVMRFNFPLVAALIVGGLVTAIFGIIIGFPTLRLRGDYLAIATLGFGEIIRVLMNNLEPLTGGAAGLKGIPPFSSTGDFLMDLLIRFSWVFIFTVLTIVLMSNLIKSSTGRAIISIREDEIAANSMGINTAYYKILAFTLSGFIAGVGGGLYATYFGYLNPLMFGFLNSVNFVVIIVLGGLGSITGTILAGVAFTYAQEWLRVLGDFRLAVFGLALVIVMIFWPGGLMGNREFSVIRFVNRVIKREITFGTIARSIVKLFKRDTKKGALAKKNGEVK